MIVGNRRARRNLHTPFETGTADMSIRKFRTIARCGVIAFVALVAPSAATAQRPTLGPKDGATMPPLDTGRVALGSVAPDFTLETKDGGTITLSQFRGKKNVVLVFYRGHW